MPRCAPTATPGCCGRNNGKWRHLKWQAIEPQMKARVAAPDTIHQTYYNISGPLTAAHMLLLRDPGRYEALVRNLYERARYDPCGVNVAKEDLLKVAVEPEHPILEVDLMVGAALTDSANWFLDSRYGLRIRAIASFDTRTGRIASREGIGVKEAERKGSVALLVKRGDSSIYFALKIK